VLRREREGDYLSGKRWNECIAASAPTHQVLIQVDDVRVRPDFVDRHVRWQGGGQLTRALVAALWREPFERPFDERMTGWASTRWSSPTAPSEPGPYRNDRGRGIDHDRHKALDGARNEEYVRSTHGLAALPRW
jgi:hypothetical protein